MQSDGNSFCGDVILDSFDIAYRDIMKVLNLRTDERKMHKTRNTEHNNKELVKLNYSPE